MDHEKLANWKFDTVEASYADHDTMLYALGIGLGADPLDREQLRFVTEPALKALPTLSTVLARNPPWLPKVGVRVTDAVHGEHRMSFDRPLPPAGRIRAASRIAGIVDKGAGRGVLVSVEQVLSDPADGQRYATSTMTAFIRGQGGFGGPTTGAPVAHKPPARPADSLDAFRTFTQQSLLYRLNGDRNPLHFDPDVAKAAGFPRPILHGFCTYGIVGWQVLKNFCGYDPARLAALELRFAAPALPGETLVTEFWRDGEVVAFRTSVAERGVVVLSHGRAVVRG